MLRNWRTTPLSLLLAGASLSSPAHAAQILPYADPFPAAAVAGEVETHSYSIARRGHPAGCVAEVSTRDDGTVFVRLATVDGRPLTFPHGPYPSEQIGMIDVLGAFGRDC